MKKIIKLFITFAFITLLVVPTPVSAEVKKTAKSAFLYDFNTKTVLYARNENERLPIASMTKIMLLNLIYENIDNGVVSFNENVIISENAAGMGGSQVFLEAGNSYSVSNLIKSITVASANDASVAMAERIYGSEANCVKAMNEKVREMGLLNTQFSNCTGLPKPMQYSSAKDITLIFADLIKHKEYFEYSNIWMDKIEHTKNATEITNTNKLVKFYNGCDGGKTGFTNEAGFCLTATAKRGNMRLISAVVGASDSKLRFNEVSSMFNEGFNTYENRAVLDVNVPVCEDFRVNGAKNKCVEVLPENNFFVLIKKGEKPEFEVDLAFNNVSAPLKRGDVVGEAHVFVKGVQEGKVNLVVRQNVDKMSFGDYIKDMAKKWA